MLIAVLLEDCVTTVECVGRRGSSPFIVQGYDLIEETCFLVVRE
jgi:hypothetical protein